MKKVIASIVGFNSFKNVWDARVMLMDGDHISIGIMIEEKPNKLLQNRPDKLPLI